MNAVDQTDGNAKLQLTRMPRVWSSRQQKEGSIEMPNKNATDMDAPWS
jgi:hypothetical protein